jgi:hypothetical protein
MKTWQSERTAPNILGTSGELHGPPSLPLANEPPIPTGDKQKTFDADGNQTAIAKKINK